MPTIFCIPPPPVGPHSKQDVVWCIHFIWCPPILTVVCFTALERSMVHNNSGHPCFEIGILHIHKNHRSIIAIITVISISLSAIVVALSSSQPPIAYLAHLPPLPLTVVFCFCCPLPVPFILDITIALLFDISQLVVLVVDFCFLALGIVRDVGEVLFKLISSGMVSSSDSTNLCAAVSGGKKLSSLSLQDSLMCYPPTIGCPAQDS